jgi:hypothetical protein
LPKLSEEYLKRTIEGKPFGNVRIDVVDGDFQYGFA